MNNDEKKQLPKCRNCAIMLTQKGLKRMKYFECGGNWEEDASREVGRYLIVPVFD